MDIKKVKFGFNVEVTKSRTKICMDVWSAAQEGRGILVGVGPAIGYLVNNAQITRLRQPMKVKQPRIIILERWNTGKT